MRINPINLTKATQLASTRSSAHRRFGTGAVIAYPGQRGNLLGTGWSHISHIRHKEVWSLHAEIHALVNVRYLTSLRGCYIYVATVRKNNNTVCSGKPCLNCAMALATRGIEFAIFTSEENDYEILDLQSELDNLKSYKINTAV